ncbi:MAG: hypothetical protein EHM34_00230 [Nitrosopumilales archaeon]|nr:MAG: hypothetical protein EHM34_00230 [Nitrosopumilales archaeon]
MVIELKAGNFVDEDKLDRNETIHFVAFLEEEKYRHVLAMRQADANRYASANIPVLQQAYQSSVIRHLEDIVFTQKAIDKLMQKYNLTARDINGV